MNKAKVQQFFPAPISAETMLVDAGFVKAESSDGFDVYFFKHELCVMFSLSSVVKFMKLVPGTKNYETFLSSTDAKKYSDNDWVMLFMLTEFITAAQFKKACKDAPIAHRITLYEPLNIIA